MPKKTLTAASVERLKAPKSGQVEYFDQGYPGLALRVSYGGRKAWSMFYRLHGKLNRMGLGIFPAMSLAEAREAWREARKSVARGIDPSQAIGAGTRPSTAFSGVAEEWLQRDQADNKSAHIVRRIVARELTPVWGSRPITEISRRDVRDLIDGITDRGAPVMARRVHSRLHRLFAWCVGRDIITVNPMVGLPKPGSETSRDRVLVDGEVVEVWNGAASLGAPFGSAHQLLILTGARREEIGGLRWSEIDGDTIKLKGERTKNGEAHDIPLSAPARALLASVPRIAGSDFVFTSTGEKPIAAWSNAKLKLDALVTIEPWRVHDLRRTVATGLQKLGVNLQTVEAILGHTGGSRAGIVGVYQRHTYSDEKRSALEAWGAHVIALIEGRAVGKVVPLRSAC
jgi:integrase